MDSCNHHPKVNISALFSKFPTYICKTCGVKIEMTPRTNMIGRIVRGLGVGLILCMVLFGGEYFSGPNTKWMYFGSMIGVIAAYVLGRMLLLNMGKFQEAPPDIISPDHSDLQSGDSKPQYTQEQLELMALYDSYVQKSAPDVDVNPNASAPIEEVPLPVHHNCTHIPTKNWKNYVPSVYDFTCERCGKKITFSTERKKRLNLMLLAFSAVILVGTFAIEEINMAQYVVLFVATIVICTGVQYYFVKKSTFEEKVE